MCFLTNSTGNILVHGYSKMLIICKFKVLTVKKIFYTVVGLNDCCVRVFG